MKRYYKQPYYSGPKFNRPSRCIETCEHLDIDDYLLEQAEEDEKNLSKQKGQSNPATLALNSRRDFIGSIAHNGVCQKLEAWNVSFEKQVYFDPKKTNDAFDFYFDSAKIDIQGSPIKPDHHGNNIIHPWTSFLIKPEKQNRGMDYFCFTSVDLENRRLHIAGLIRSDNIWKEERFRTRVIHPAYEVYAREMRSLSSFIFRV